MSKKSNGSYHSHTLLSDPNQTDALTIRAHVFYLLDSQSFSVIQQHLQKALRLDPDHKKARLLLKKVKALDVVKNEGNGFFSEGKMTQAEEVYNRYLEMDTDGGVMKVKVLSNRATVRSRVSRGHLPIF